MRSSFVLNPLIALLIFSTSGREPRALAASHDPAGDMISSILKAFATATRSGGAQSVAEFQVAGCAIPIQKWAPYLVGGTLTHHFRFGAGCDLEGDLLMTHEPFPIDFKVRHLADFKRVRATLAVTPGLDFEEREATVSISAANGVFTDAAAAATEFRGDYRCLVGLDGRIARGPGKTGGLLHFSRLRGKVVSIDAPISR